MSNFVNKFIVFKEADNVPLCLQSSMIVRQNLTIPNLATTANMVLLPLNVQQQPSRAAYARFQFAKQLLTETAGATSCAWYNKEEASKKEINHYFKIYQAHYYVHLVFQFLYILSTTSFPISCFIFPYISYDRTFF